MYTFRITFPNGTEKTATDPEQVYYHIALHLCDDLKNISETDHMIAANAESWCGLLAYPDTRYEDSRLPGLTIDVEDDEDI